MNKTQEQITKTMKAVKSKNTKIEIKLRKELWKRRLFYRKNQNKIFGKPDIVFKRIKLAVFCDSEFWHGYQWQEKAKAEHKSNQEYWYKKIERNIERDKEVNAELQKMGWTVLRFWGNEIEKDPIKCTDTIEKTINELQNLIVK